MLVQFVFPSHARIYQAKRAGLERNIEVITLDLGELRPARTQIDRTSRTIIFRTLENAAALAIIQRDFLDIIQREFAQIDLTVLSISNLDAVIKHSQMVGTHRPDIDRLKATHSTIIFELNPCEIAHGIGY